MCVQYYPLIKNSSTQPCLAIVSLFSMLTLSLSISVLSHSAVKLPEHFYSKIIFMLMLKKEMLILQWKFRFLENEKLRNYFCRAHCKLPLYILLEDKSFVEIKGTNS